jgi:linoleoyl-CoA desaturase
MAPRVRSICEKYGQHYNTGSFVKQYGEVPKRIFALLAAGWLV